MSLVEACRKLNEVIGLKGMSRYSRWDPVPPSGGCSQGGHRCDNPPALPRYFKQIVKSARANGRAGPPEDHTDDFLGCLNIPIWVSGAEVSLTEHLPVGASPSWDTASGYVL